MTITPVLVWCQFHVVALYPFTWYRYKISCRFDSYRNEFIPVSVPGWAFRCGTKTRTGIIQTTKRPLVSVKRGWSSPVSVWNGLLVNRNGSAYVIFVMQAAWNRKSHRYGMYTLPIVEAYSRMGVGGSRVNQCLGIAVQLHEGMKTWRLRQNKT